LATTRRHELRRAAAVLSVPEPVSLGLPDGQLADHEDTLTDLLTGILGTSGTRPWCAATWRGDGHPDHEAVGRAAASACARTGAELLEYPVWMWHWASPSDAAVPWDRAHAAPLSDWAIARKREAAQCFRSQFEQGIAGATAVLPPFVLRRLLTVGELVFR
jgi:LmbE family N-acetylglucosaminyl deacetylase